MMAGNHVAPETSYRTRNYLMAFVFRSEACMGRADLLKQLFARIDADLAAQPTHWPGAQRWRDFEVVACFLPKTGDRIDNAVNKRSMNCLQSGSLLLSEIATSGPQT